MLVSREVRAQRLPVGRERDGHFGLRTNAPAAQNLSQCTTAASLAVC
jgi:hypothetical protein